MFRLVEPDGRAAWYFGPQTIYVTLAFVVAVLVVWEVVLPDRWLEPQGDARVVNNAYAAVYESRVNAILRAAAVTGNRTVTSGIRTVTSGNKTEMSGNRAVKSANKRTKLPTCLRPHRYKFNMSDDDTPPGTTLEDIAQRHVDLVGGAWRPRDCSPRHRVAIVIPYRDRKEHLIRVLSVLVPLLKTQRLHFKIYLPEQVGVGVFNKGVLMNAAFLEALRDDAWDCFVFHDVDLVPEHPGILYSCPGYPTHLSVAIDEMGYVLPYEDLVGGVLILRTEHFVAANGYSNMFWGWGAEDDDMYKRIMNSQLPLKRLPFTVSRYHQIRHKKREPAVWKIRYKNLRTAESRMSYDGVNSVQYRLVAKTNRALFSHLLIDVGQPPKI